MIHSSARDLSSLRRQHDDHWGWTSVKRRGRQSTTSLISLVSLRFSPSKKCNELLIFRPLVARSYNTHACLQSHLVAGLPRRVESDYVWDVSYQEQLRLKLSNNCYDELLFY
ncbi:hypothetical protein TNIN_196861 [Trichonephila inaurata madagascariensis]|uniref:Uncharacterized protein n=1 Tax=Trichonephila inaurata madagascariensis TaxID=2747483 RepID=A0A8X7CLV3_9ARAC|nr:hypothetical protein TNIN_196861 [Trichonephila inaurata madagascariensis]